MKSVQSVSSVIPGSPYMMSSQAKIERQTSYDCARRVIRSAARNASAWIVIVG